MITKNIGIKNFNFKKKNQKVKKELRILLSQQNEILNSLKDNYINKYNIRKIKHQIVKRSIRLIGMGGYILGEKAIYEFLKKKIKKKFLFYDNLKNFDDRNLIKNQFNANIII